MKHEIYDVAAERLDVSTLAKVMENMVDHTGPRRQALQDTAASVADESTPLAFGQPDAGFRV
ncbi:MAG: hypothetical protein MI861_14740 [Pirellulales bacterium]|nr:hypothetical protein [Pirellulales bacterium]